MNALAKMTRAEFDALPEFSCSLPTGISLGRKWKRKTIDRGGLVAWFQGEFTKNLPVPTCCRYHRCIAGYIDASPCSQTNGYDPADPEAWCESPNRLVEIEWKLIIVVAPEKELEVYLL